MPLVSVIMSVYKEPIEWIKQSIDSILTQTLNDIELIVVNDNPDCVKNQMLLNEYANKDERIIVLNNDINEGLPKSLNKALCIATGEYIARMDADDIALNNRLSKQIKFLKNNPKVDICGTNRRIYKDGYVRRIKSHVAEKHNEIGTVMLFNSPFVHPTVMFRRRIIEKVRYNESFLKSQDYELWERLYEQGVVFANLDEVLLLYRTSSLQATSSQNSVVIENGNLIRNRFFKFIGLELSRTKTSLLGYAFDKSKTDVCFADICQLLICMKDKVFDLGLDMKTYNRYSLRILFLILRKSQYKLKDLIYIYKIGLLNFDGLAYNLMDVLFNLMDKTFISSILWKKYTNV